MKTFKIIEYKSNGNDLKTVTKQLKNVYGLYYIDEPEYNDFDKKNKVSLYFCCAESSVGYCTQRNLNEDLVTEQNIKQLKIQTLEDYMKMCLQMIVSNSYIQEIIIEFAKHFDIELAKKLYNSKQEYLKRQREQEEKEFLERKHQQELEEEREIREKLQVVQNQKSELYGFTNNKTQLQHGKIYSTLTKTVRFYDVNKNIKTLTKVEYIKYWIGNGYIAEQYTETAYKKVANYNNACGVKNMECEEYTKTGYRLRNNLPNNIFNCIDITKTEYDLANYLLKTKGE